MKLKDKKGLTLVEMLCTVAILVLVSMVMVLGVQLGVRSYAKSVSYSEAQVLCSTLTTTISDELRYSGTLKVDGSGSVTGFFSQQFGSGDYTAFTTTPEGHVQLGGKDILPAKAYPYGIKAEVKSLTYDDVTALFTVQLSVKDSENKNTLAETTFEVEKLNVTTEDTAEGRARAEDIRTRVKFNLCSASGWQTKPLLVQMTLKAPAYGFWCVVMALRIRAAMIVIIVHLCFLVQIPAFMSRIVHRPLGKAEIQNSNG